MKKWAVLLTRGDLLVKEWAAMRNKLYTNTHTQFWNQVRCKWQIWWMQRDYWSENVKGRSSQKWKENMKMDIKYVGWKCVKWTQVAYDRYYRKWLVTAVLRWFVVELSARQVLKKLLLPLCVQKTHICRNVPLNSYQFCLLPKRFKPNTIYLPTL
jgi:hypothetical protein